MITPEKIVSFKGFLPSSNTSVKKDFETDALILTNTVTHFQVLSANFIEYEQNINNTKYPIDKLFCEK